MNSMLSFVLSHAPQLWEEVDKYIESYALFDLSPYTQEYINVNNLFKPSLVTIKSIKRVQQPFQYGRFKLRQEMLSTTFEETVFHIVHPNDLDIALKFTCDYRRYKHMNDYSQQITKQPKFYNMYEKETLMNDILKTEFKIVLVLSKISGRLETQSDYYIQYIIDTI